MLQAQSQEDRCGAAATPWDLQITGVGGGREEGVLICA